MGDPPKLLAIVANDRDLRLPVDAHANLIVLAAQLQAVQTIERSSLGSALRHERMFFNLRKALEAWKSRGDRTSSKG